MVVVVDVMVVEIELVLGLLSPATETTPFLLLKEGFLLGGESSPTTRNPSEDEDFHDGAAENEEAKIAGRFDPEETNTGC